MFENRYEITRKLYADWARRPVLLTGRRRIPLLPVLVAVGWTADGATGPCSPCCWH